MKFGSLFTGFGGMDLGLEQAGLRCEWQVEINEYARKVLNKHWATVPKYSDIRECGKHNLAPVQVIAGGFPCQDISVVGKRVGITGERSGLWTEMHRIICEIRPRFIIVENVADLLGRGMGRVLGDLSASGYDAEWRVLRACDFGLPHRRERVFIVAYASGTVEGIRGFWELPQVTPPHWSGFLHDTRGRGVDGIPATVERFRGTGNAVVPVIARWIGERIQETKAAA